MTALRLPTMYIVPRPGALVTTTYNRKRKRWQQTCRCDAYPFPHRLYGGRCCGSHHDPEPELIDPWREAGVAQADFLDFGRWGA